MKTIYDFVEGTDCEKQKPFSGESGSFRKEQKYLCSFVEMQEMRIQLSGVMEKDSHVGSDGTYRIRSIYFDTPDDLCVRQNEDGVDERSKWRIRIYNEDRSAIFLECKDKIHDMTRKEACRITEAEFRELMGKDAVGGLDSAGREERSGISGNSGQKGTNDISGDEDQEATFGISAGAGQGAVIAEDRKEEIFKGTGVSKMAEPLLNRFRYLQRAMGLRPAVIVRYQREPFVCRYGNVRVTRDFALESSRDFGHFFDPVLTARPVLPKGVELLEVKYDEFMPAYLRQAIQTRDMQQTSFSKYYLCRRYGMYGGYV